MSAPTANRPTPKAPSPEQMGFKVIVGKDVLEGPGYGPNASPSERIAGMRLDNTVERKSRWEQYLGNIGKTALDPEKRTAAVAELSSDVASEEDPYTRDALEYVKSMIANFEDPVAAKLILDRGKRGSMQESIARAVIPYKYNANELGNAVHSALKLAEERYFQEHGEAYQTAEQKRELQEAKERASGIDVK